ncbi:hypothetical protein GCM10009665_33380 [Kitasatospora nipponensis]|uniref:Uncharacterized protein n=1 Tax=Kitasatospora nipponensis TaxID=258049 RepID=A0ABN1W848_9ACTN
MIRHSDPALLSSPREGWTLCPLLVPAPGGLPEPTNATSEPDPDLETAALALPLFDRLRTDADAASRALVAMALPSTRVRWIRLTRPGCT